MPSLFGRDPPAANQTFIGRDADATWGIEYILCPNEKCRRYVVFLLGGTKGTDQAGKTVFVEKTRTLVRPKGAGRFPPPSEVPKGFADEFLEACMVVVDSPKASAALSRRCLQRLLREVSGVKPGDLADEIQRVIDSDKLPSYLADQIDGVRNIGNFASHPIKSRSTGEIVDVEPGEAEANLDTLEGLFDFYFVSPARAKERRDALNKKLKDAGKPRMKGS